MLMLGPSPPTVAVWDVACVELVAQYVSDGIVGKRSGALGPSCPVTCRIDSHGYLPVEFAVCSKLKHHFQAIELRRHPCPTGMRAWHCKLVTTEH